MSEDVGHTIASLLARRNASLKGEPGSHETANSRAPLTRLIQSNYQIFEPLRDDLLNRQYVHGKFCELCDIGKAMIEAMHDYDMMADHQVHERNAKSPEARRYLAGGWLEELAFLAAMEAGAEEAVYGQVLHWHAKGYTGHNEVDLIMRKGERLGFISCKAVASQFDSSSRKHRNRLMDALHEADNLADHFGGDDDKVAVLVTADLIDEEKDQPRYMSLMGKAAVLDVRIIPLEEMEWEPLVGAVAELID